MEYSKSLQQQNPYETAGLISRLLFLWPWRIISMGRSKTLVQNDLPHICSEESSKGLSEQVMENWKIAKSKSKQSALLHALSASFAPKFWWLALVILFESATRIFQAKLLGYLVAYFMDPTANNDSLFNNGYFLSGLISICGVIVCLLHHQLFFYSSRYGLQLRLSLSSAIYNKAIMLHMREFSHLSSGHIVNLCSQDVESFVQTGVFLHFSYAPLLESIAIIIFGYYEVGYAFLIGFSVILLLIPLQWWFSKLITRIRINTVSRTDKRVKLSNQALVGARLMKINGWEWTFKDIINVARKDELDSYIQASYLKAINEVYMY
jgi:ABC-type multidrug transport system fused ATPase/permease subunit